MFESVCNYVFQSEEERSMARSWLQRKSSQELVMGDQSLQERSSSSSAAAVSTNSVKSTIFAVSFQAETDGRENFPNDASFHSFRKQRDMFYELYYKWRTMNGYPSFDGRIQQADRHDARFRFEESVRRIYTLSTDSGNMYHLARLLVSQLIRSCVMKVDGFELVEPLIAEKNALDDQRRKLKMLNRRMQTGSVKEESIGTLFSSEESFFNKFIVESNFAFHANLRLVLIERISQLNTPNSVFGYYDEDVEETIGRYNRKTKFSSAVSTLMLLAKTLALVDFFPFKTKNITSSQYSSRQTEIRSKFAPDDLNLAQILRKSLKDHYLILSMPWILEYLKHADGIAVNLPSFQKLLVVVFDCVCHLAKTPDSCSEASKIFLLVSFAQFLEKQGTALQQRFLKHCPNELSTLSKASPIKRHLDNLSSLVDQQLVFEVYPKLSIPVPIVKPGAEKPVTKLTPRKIRPLAVPREGSSSSQLVVKKTLNDHKKRGFEYRFEDNFMNLHPPYLKRTVEFLAERISSRCIKELRTGVLNSSMQDHLDVEELNVTTDALEKIKTDCSKFVHQFCKDEITKTMPLLLSDADINQEVRVTAESICIRQSAETCCTWLANNVTQELLVSNLNKLLRCQNKRSESSGEVVSYREQFNQARRIVIVLLTMKHAPVPVEDIKTVISELKELRNCTSLLSSTKEFIDVIISDLLIAVISTKPHYCEDGLLSHFFDYWNSCGVKVSKLISPRNLVILFRGITEPSSWSKYEHVILGLLKKGFIDADTIEADCLWVLKHEWTDSQLSRIASVLDAVVKAHRSTEGKAANDFDEIMSWLTWFCSQSATENY